MSIDLSDFVRAQKSKGNWYNKALIKNIKIVQKTQKTKQKKHTRGEQW